MQGNCIIKQLAHSSYLADPRYKHQHRFSMLFDALPSHSRDMLQVLLLDAPHTQPLRPRTIQHLNRMRDSGSGNDWCVIKQLRVTLGVHSGRHSHEIKR